MNLQNKENTHLPIESESPKVIITIPESPRRNDDDDDDDSDFVDSQPQKPALPRWAQSPFLQKQLREQMNRNPDLIFCGRKKCDLNEIFSNPKNPRWKLKDKDAFQWGESD